VQPWRVRGGSERSGHGGNMCGPEHRQDMGCARFLSSVEDCAATHLVNLHLLNIPSSGYISPEAMVTLPLHVDQPPNISTLNSDTLDLTPTSEADVHFR
jgi:hypothetical protein